jgi:hypothetical protein
VGDPAVDVVAILIDETPAVFKEMPVKGPATPEPFVMNQSPTAGVLTLVAGTRLGTDNCQTKSPVVVPVVYPGKALPIAGDSRTGKYLRHRLST